MLFGAETISSAIVSSFAREVKTLFSSPETRGDLLSSFEVSVSLSFTTFLSCFAFLLDFPAKAHSWNFFCFPFRGSYPEIGLSRE